MSLLLRIWILRCDSKEFKRLFFLSLNTFLWFRISIPRIKSANMLTISRVTIFFYQRTLDTLKYSIGDSFFHLMKTNKSTSKLKIIDLVIDKLVLALLISQKFYKKTVIIRTFFVIAVCDFDFFDRFSWFLAHTKFVRFVGVFWYLSKLVYLNLIRTSKRRK